MKKNQNNLIYGGQQKIGLKKIFLDAAKKLFLEKQKKLAH
jgi:hypothetical protein